MNNKLTISEIAGLLTEYTGKDRKSTEQFLREFIAVVSEGVLADKLVKVKGIGTFKIIPVEQRESIHINTGERIVIPAHSKFSFIPDKDLREEVNKPFSFFETIEINNDHGFPEPPADNIENMISVADPDTEEESVLPEKELPVIEEPVTTPEPIQEPEKEELVEEPEKPVSSESIEELLPQSSGETVVPEIQKPPVFTESIAEEKDESKPKKNSSARFIWIAASLLALLLIGGGSFLLISDSELISSSVAKTIVPVEEVQSQIQTHEVIADNSSTLVEVEVEEWQAVETSADLGEEKPKEKKEVIATVKLEPGNRLTLISLEHYGNKVFWVYIYEYNKSTIKDPNNIPVGTEIKVPVPELYNINAKDPASVNKASELQTTILTEGIW